jgi:4-hydroxy-tetrahydrodipicolinate synthase
MSTRIRGAVAPVLTPFNERLEPDVDRFIAHCRWLIGNQASLAIFGTNSEAASLSVGERLSMTDAILADGIPPNRLMPGTGACALTDAVALTRHAVQNGAAGVLMLPPFYYKGVSDEGLYAYYAETIERVGDERLRIYLYHIPQLTQVPITLDLIGMLRKRYPDTVVGAKDSSGDWDNTKAMIENFAKDGFDVFPASE